MWRRAGQLKSKQWRGKEGPEIAIPDLIRRGAGSGAGRAKRQPEMQNERNVSRALDEEPRTFQRELPSRHACGSSSKLFSSH